MLTMDGITSKPLETVPAVSEAKWQVAGPRKQRRWAPLPCAIGCASACQHHNVATVTSEPGKAYYDKNAISPAAASMILALTASEDRAEALNQIAAQGTEESREG